VAAHSKVPIQECLTGDAHVQGERLRCRRAGQVEALRPKVHFHSDIPVKPRTAINMHFGRAVRRFRSELAISQELLAERAGLDRTYIGHVERGARNVSLATIDKLARALEVTSAALLFGVGTAELPVDQTQFGPHTGYARGNYVDVLLVENDLSDERLTLRAVKRAGITNPVQVIRDGAEALEFLLCTGHYASRSIADRLQLVLMDLQLPSLSGLEVLRAIKEDPRTARIRVVVMTASRSSGCIQEACRLGAAGYIIKPLDFQSLSEMTPKLNLQWTLVQPAAGALA
jgi:two-component system, response regulator